MNSPCRYHDEISYLVNISKGPQGTVVRWLLVFDNVSNMSLLESYWPQASKGSIIITCRSAEIANRFASEKLSNILVDPFTTSVASRFLLSLVDKNLSHSPEEELLALKVSESVGNHPLALDIIGCYLRKCGKSLTTFAREHPTFERDFLFQPGLAEWTENSYQRSISNAWTMNLSAAGLDQSLDAGSTLLIQMLAFLDEDGAPLSLLTNNKRDEM